MNQTAKSPGLRDPKAFADDFRNRGHEQSRKLWEDSIFKCKWKFPKLFQYFFPDVVHRLGEEKHRRLGGEVLST